MHRRTGSSGYSLEEILVRGGTNQEEAAMAACATRGVVLGAGWRSEC